MVAFLTTLLGLGGLDDTEESTSDLQRDVQSDPALTKQLDADGRQRGKTPTNATRLLFFCFSGSLLVFTCLFPLFPPIFFFDFVLSCGLCGRRPVHFL